MAQFTVNGKTVTVEKNQKLMRYLRDELRLLSVKDGCAEGACGACTIIIDGKTQRACIPMTDKMEGKSVLTVEGLSDFEKRNRQLCRKAFGSDTYEAVTADMTGGNSEKNIRTLLSVEEWEMLQSTQKRKQKKVRISIG